LVHPAIAGCGVKKNSESPVTCSLQSNKEEIWKGSPVSAIEECVGFFVTTNYPWAKASARLCSEGMHVGIGLHCLPSDQLTSLAWAKSPESGFDLPRAQLIADCIRAARQNLIQKL
jgi:hypothetical protein